MVDWDKLKQQVNHFLNFSDSKAYLPKLIENFEKKCTEQEHHPFKIIDIREKGFSVKVYGLFGFISFRHMPWEYNSIGSWKAIFPYLKGKVFFCKIHNFEKDKISIIIDGKIPQFRKPELFEDLQYKGIITSTAPYGVFVDIGYSFDWKCGSISGLLHKSNFENDKVFDEITPGEIIELFFWGYNENEQLILGIKPELKEWFTAEIENIIDEVLPVRIIKSENGKTNYIANEKYLATLPITKLLYPENLKNIKTAINNLKNDDIIHCKVVNVNRPKRTLQLVWESLSEIEDITSRNNEHNLIRNRINIEILEKLEFIGKTVEVEVIRKKDNSGRIYTKYLVENKHIGKMNISSDSYKISKKEKKQIEEKLKDGEILSCEVIKAENNFLRIKWHLKDNELINLRDDT